MRTDLPNGTVTLLFTDVDSSTKLLHQLGAEAYADALAEHRHVMREACRREGGAEVDTQGDAFFFAFPTAEGAVRAAASFTEELRAGPIQVRVGLHTGTPFRTDEGYVGDDVHFAARVAASAHGGQVVISSATAALVDADLLDLGEHRLKDIAQAVPIYQLGSGSFPPLKTISNTNLPRPASSFVGRECELEEVLARLTEGARLLTLTGPGGSGKTRLALEAAASLVPEYKAGVFWVGLAPLRDAALVTETIAQTLGAKEGLAEHIGEREMLLLLDNVEQVIEAAPEFASLLESCPNVALLVTSRELLRVRGEVEYPVPPLASREAVALFCERAGLKPDDDVWQVCARLDNLPLAVELAAARTKALTPAQILERLSRRLDLLKGGRDAEARHETLRATIEWSYDLLSDEEQRLFARLSVFAGGCTLEAAEQVAGADVDTLQSLVEKSLLRFAGGDPGSRYWLLETIREYASERFGGDSSSDPVRLRHAQHFADQAEEAGQAIDRGHQGDALDRLNRDHDNVRTALSWTLANDKRRLALRLAVGCWRYLVVRGYVREARLWLEQAVAGAGTDDVVLLARALDGLAYTTAITGDGAAAVALSDRSLSLWREAGDQVGLATSLLRRQIALAEAGDEEAYRTTCEETIELAREVGAEDVLATSLNNLADTLLVAGDYASAERLCNESVELHRKRGDIYDGAGALINAGHAALCQGKLDVAARRYGEAIHALARTAAPDVLAWSLVSVAALAEARGDTRAAATLLGASSALFDQIEAVRNWPYEDALRVQTLSRIRDASDGHDVEEAFERGAVMSNEEAIAAALAMTESPSKYARSERSRYRS